MYIVSGLFRVEYSPPFTKDALSIPGLYCISAFISDFDREVDAKAEFLSLLLEAQDRLETASAEAYPVAASDGTKAIATRVNEVPSLTVLHRWTSEMLLDGSIEQLKEAHERSVKSFAASYSCFGGDSV